MHRFWLPGAAALLAACTTVPDTVSSIATARAVLDAAPACCGGLAEARRMPLPNERTVVQIDERSQVHLFDGSSKSYFVLYELPPFARPYSIVVSGLATGPVQDMAIFIPRIALFDAGFRPTRAFDEEGLRNRGNNVERTVFVNPGNAGERYLAIHGSELATSTERAYSMVTATPVVAGRAVMSLAGGHDGTSVLRSAPVGSLRIDVEGLERPAAK